MSNHSNEPSVERPPATSDLALTSGEIVASEAKVISRPTLGQMISLFTALLAIISFFLPWANIVVVNLSGFQLATSGAARAVMPTLPILWIVPVTMIGWIVLTLLRNEFGATNRIVSIASVSVGILNVAVILYHILGAQTVVPLLFGIYACLFSSFIVASGGVIDLVYKTAEKPSGKFKISTDVLRAYTMVFALIAIWIYFHYSTDQIFLDPRNFSNLMRQTAVTGVLAVGMLMVIITGQIDLSVGSVVGLAGGIAAITQGWLGWGLVPSLASGIAVGIAIGGIHGGLTAYVNVPAFIVTLGGLLAWRGVILGLSRGETIPIRLPAFKSIGQDYVGPMVGWVIAAIAVAAIIWLSLARSRARRRHGLEAAGPGVMLMRILGPSIAVVGFIYMMNSYEIAPGRYAGIPIPVIIFLAIALAGAFLTQNTTFGRYLYAIGGNPDAARLSGINIRRHLLAVFCIMGALSGVAAIIYTARVGSASPDAGQLLELDAIAACVIGGTSLMGGRGTVFGAILGALIMASLDNGMSLKNVEPYMQNIIKGAILVAAVGLDMAGRKRG